MKTCNNCGASDFYKNGRCRPCKLTRSKAWYYHNKDKQEYKKAANKRSKKWHQVNPDRSKQVYRRHDLKRKYGLTDERFNNMLCEQGNGCAICHGPANGRGNYHVDHDHKSGKIRGLLCHNCNLMLGNAVDSPARLEEGAAYLRRHGK